MSKHDPLEDAKVVEKKPEPVRAKVKTPDPASEPEPARPLAVPANDVYHRVLKDKVASYRGHINKYVAGTLLLERAYGGPEGIQLLRDAGVELELVK